MEHPPSHLEMLRALAICKLFMDGNEACPMPEHLFETLQTSVITLRSVLGMSDTFAELIRHMEAGLAEHGMYLEVTETDFCTKRLHPKPTHAKSPRSAQPSRSSQA